MSPRVRALEDVLAALERLAPVDDDDGTIAQGIELAAAEVRRMVAAEPVRDLLPQLPEFVDLAGVTLPRPPDGERVEFSITSTKGGEPFVRGTLDHAGRITIDRYSRDFAIKRKGDKVQIEP